MLHVYVYYYTTTLDCWSHVQACKQKTPRGVISINKDTSLESTTKFGASE